jgi:hypothetical protein
VAPGGNAAGRGETDHSASVILSGAKNLASSSSNVDPSLRSG